MGKIIGIDLGPRIACSGCEGGEPVVIPTPRAVEPREHGGDHGGGRAPRRPGGKRRPSPTRNTVFAI